MAGVNKIRVLWVLLWMAVLFAGCQSGGITAGGSESRPPSEPVPVGSDAAAQPGTEPSIDMAAVSQAAETEMTQEADSEMNMLVQVGGSTFTAVLEHNRAVDALVEMMKEGPVTLSLRDYGGFEKVGPLGKRLPTSNAQADTHPGDIVLYQGDQIVMFYGNNSWSYTRLGHVEALDGWEEALGSGDITVTFSLEG